MKKKYLSLLILRIPKIISWLSIIILFKLEAKAQLIPDNTLGSESSIVVPQDALNDVIEGGAQRGSNLFQSFSEFNVGEGRGVTFANPPGVENILNRVTGGNPSNIFGRLGVAGGANLFLINPAGIIFGPNAILDVSGSFTATTADGFQLGEGSFFSATNIPGSSLLSVSPSALFFNQVAAQQTGNIIVNSSLNNLSGDSNLTLLSTNNIFIENTLDLQRGIGTIEFKADVDGDLTGDFIVTDTTNTIFTNGRDINIEGNNLVTGDIDTSSDLGGGNISLTAGVGGDISSGDIDSSSFVGEGGFIVLEADGDISSGAIDSSSLVGEPGFIILEADGDISSGDIDSSSYIGKGGVVTLEAGGDVNLTSVSSLSSNGGDGGAITIQAGGDVDLNSVSSLSSNGGDGGAITIQAGGNISSEYIGSTSGEKNGGAITIEAGGDINSEFITSFSYVGTAGAITIEAEGDINSGIIDLSTYDGDAGAITIEAEGDINSGLITSFSLEGDAGAITIQAEGDINLGLIAAFSFADIGNTSTGDSELSTGGNISVKSGGNISIKDGGLVSDGGIQGSIIVESAGNVVIEKGNIENIKFGVENIDSENLTNIEIKANSLVLKNGSVIQIGSLQLGTPSDIIIKTTDSITINDSIISSSVLNLTSLEDTIDQIIDAFTFLSVPESLESLEIPEIESTGDSGNITITTPQLSVMNGAQIEASTLTSGNAGNISITTTESIILDNTDKSETLTGIFSNSIGGGTGDGGNITIETESITIKNGAQIGVNSEDAGDAGSIEVKATNSILIESGEILSNSTGSGIAGDIDLTASQDINSINSTVNATSLETGGGNINFTANNIELENINFGTEVFNATGGGGDIEINANVFIALGNSNFSASAIEGEGGNILINADVFLVDEAVSLDASAGIEISGRLNILPEVNAESKLTNSQQILANSCLARKGRQQNSFTVTGVDTLPVLPYQRQIGQFRVTDVSNIGNQNTIVSPIENQPTTAQWKIGDAVEEAGGIIISDSGKIMLGSMAQVTEIAKADDLICH